MFSIFNRKDSHSSKKANPMKHEAAKTDHQGEIPTDSLFNSKFHMTGKTEAVSETDNLCSSNMRGPAFSKQPNIPNEFQHLHDPKISILTKQQLKRRNTSGKNWHSILFNGKEIYGSDTAITAYDLNHPIRMITSNPDYDGKPILILTGSHGDAFGFNWDANTNGVRRKDLREKLFFNEDRDDRKGEYDRSEPIHIKDVRKTTYQEMEEIINSPDYHVILGYCFSRNDQALRFYTNTNPVKSYIDN
ncbi:MULTISPECIES: hypothetical protein [Photorhabdus]|uniref:Uncharacterized protein n=1 Tax=Photorhabdus thracensis TaxID=230089 RepID=A0A0F7LPV8_9GAMM|nr:hypothetical protein [Photorhabdus thracensis]AKH64595.1 hypothetical protein VY86_15910 [Photorhabdus thracensis]MCC8423212.1 hypothetical protein [Photorhabdus thracensis]